MSIFHLPDLGEGLEEAEIRSWYVKVGDHVKIDQPLVSVETAKAVVDVPSPQAGQIKKLYANAGEFIKTHGPLIEFEENGGTKSGSIVGKLDESSVLLDEAGPTLDLSNKKVSSIKVLPAIRHLAKQLNVDIHQIKASGPEGQITAEDVKKAASTSSSFQGFSETLHGVRHFMAGAMAASHQEVVPVTLIDDADITDSANQDISLALIKAILSAVKAEPALNAWYHGKTKTRELHQTVQLGLAIDSDDGLFVPVLKNIENKSSDEIRQEIESFKKNIKSRTIAKEDLQGATFTLSNFGVFSGRYATVTIMPPMVAILGCGKIRDSVCAREGKIEIRRIAPLSLSFDHRAVTGGEAARFLAAIISSLEGKSVI